MGIIVDQNSNRSKLQERLAAELIEKSRKKALDGGDGSGEPTQKMPDGVDDSAYIEGTKTTTSLAWVWIVLAVIGIGAVLWLVIVALNR